MRPRPFRFPRSTIFLMLLIFVSVIFAIEQGRSIAAQYSSDARFETTWMGLYGLFMFLAAALCSIGALGYGILAALRQSGMQRFANVQTWSGRR